MSIFLVNIKIYKKKILILNSRGSKDNRNLLKGRRKNDVWKI